jgi:maltose alpha-D-glucosyltransferase/alpha-amylase
MYSQYAADPQMRLNLGIRRRLAPLLENSRRRIELMNSLLFSMPGTPIIYYGDEIGMGDNVYLGDRNGVRTPMQWSSDRNAGFSRTDPARLYFPVIMDPVYGYESINVEAQERSPFSLLHWMKRMIALRRQHAVFGRGSIEFIRTDNRKVLTYVRRDDNDVVLCVANLARTVQPVEIPLASFAGLTPVEMLGQTEFPRISDSQPYFLTLAPYGFYWFKLLETPALAPTARQAPPADERVELPALFAGVVWDAIFDGSMRSIIERQALIPFLQRQRWFGGKARPIAAARFVDWATLRRGAHPAFLTIVDVKYRDGGGDRYVMPLAMASGAEAAALEPQVPSAVLTRISGARKGLLFDGLLDDDLCDTLLTAVETGRDVIMKSGRLSGALAAGATERPAAPARTPIVRSAPDQSNTSVIFGWQSILKLFRRLEPGPNPDVEIGEFLTARGFSRIPPLVGSLSYALTGEQPAAVAMLQQFVPNQGNGWQVTLDELGRYFDRVLSYPMPVAARPEARTWMLSPDATVPPHVAEAISTYLATASILGRRTGELHVAVASGTEPAFAPEDYTSKDLRHTAEAMRQHGERQLALLQQTLASLDERRQTLATEVLARRDALLAQFDDLARVADGGRRIRCHGDYHLGQVLVTEGDVVILDFEGEPARPLAERRGKCSPLRDVAGMLRSFSYAALAGLGAASVTRPEDFARLSPWADFWEAWVSAAFLRAYFAAATRGTILPADSDAAETVLQSFVVDKALYELGYELNNRPEWVHIPLTGLLRLRSALHA